MRGSQLFLISKQIPVESVLGKQPEAAEAVEKEIANNKVEVSVEFVGSGVIALPYFEVKERTLSDLIRALNLEILKKEPDRRNVLLSQPLIIKTLLQATGIKEVPLVIFKLFLGQGGPEVKDISDIKDGAVLVISSKVEFFGKLCCANFAGADFTGADFTGADLTSADFTNATLANANFTGANITGAKFTKANLTNATFIEAKGQTCPAISNRTTFRGANLTDANFTKTLFRYDDFREARLSNAKFIGASLVDVDFTGAQLKEADFTNAVIRGTKFNNATLSNAKFIRAQFAPFTDFTDANLTEADFTNTDLRGIKFERAQLTGVDFKGAKLGGSIASQVEIEIINNVISKDPEALSRLLPKVEDLKKFIFDVLIASAKLQGACFRGGDLSNAVFEGYDLRGVDFGNANLTKANFTKANLTETNLQGAILIEAIFTGADLRWANLRDANLKGADFREAKLGGPQIDQEDVRKINGEFVDFEWTILALANFCADFHGMTLKEVMYNFSLGMNKLASADLRNAVLEEAKFEGADLRGAIVSIDQLRLAVGVTEAQENEVRKPEDEDREPQSRSSNRVIYSEDCYTDEAYKKRENSCSIL